MRKVFLGLLLLTIFLFGIRNYVYCQSPTSSLPFPGAVCGNADASNPTERKCCNSSSLSNQIKTPWQKVMDSYGWIYGIPYVGGQAVGEIEAFKNRIDQASQNINYPPCLVGNPVPNPGDPNCECRHISPTPFEAVKYLCRTYLTGKEKNRCDECAASEGIWTAFGCFYGDITRFISEKVFGLGVGAGGMIAFLCIIYSAFQLQISAGSPERIKKAQELLTSCIMGLMLIIFSIFILRVIGVDILRIPGLI